MADERRSIAAELAYAARIRHNVLHVWSMRLVSRASALRIVAPPVRQVTASARGSARDHGAAVADVARINRAALSYGAGMAIQMATLHLTPPLVVGSFD